MRDARTLAVRLDRFETLAVEKLAEEQGVTASDLVRGWLMTEIFKRAHLPLAAK
jgi:hypothetical protein